MPATAFGIMETIHLVNEAKYSGISLSSKQKAEAAKIIASRQGLPGAYANSFAGVGDEVKEIRLYTGERITSASARHLLGQECCRALRLLGRELKALKRAEEGLHAALLRSDADPRSKGIGWFCCGKCSVGVWRSIIVGAYDRHEERLAQGVKVLKSMRDENGKWTRFPFWYTVLALAEMDFPSARQVLEYARKNIERVAKKSTWRDDAERRRIEFAMRCF